MYAASTYIVSIAKDRFPWFSLFVCSLTKSLNVSAPSTPSQVEIMLVTPFVMSEVGSFQMRSLLKDYDRVTRFGQLFGNNAACRTGANDDKVNLLSCFKSWSR